MLSLGLKDLLGPVTRVKKKKKRSYRNLLQAVSLRHRLEHHHLDRVWRLFRVQGLIPASGFEVWGLGSIEECEFRTQTRTGGAPGPSSKVRGWG